MARATQTFSITRTRNTFKPRVNEEDVPFLQDVHGNVLLGVSGGEPISYTGSMSTEVAHLPYSQLKESEADGGNAAHEYLTEADLPEGLKLDYEINGGFNNNCLIVTWSDTTEHPCEWICLKTFTGMQLKYAMPKKRNRMIFAFADEDAFAYCNKEPCVECGFRCKSGFVLYANFKGLGIVKKPVERISMLGIIGDGGLESGTTDHRH